jgi:opacity protein-like surface antigen
VLDFKVTHRFGKLNTGFYNTFGLDVASMRIGVDYGITDRLTIGLGRSTSGKNVDTSISSEESKEKEYDGFLKYKLLWQSAGQRNMPVSVTLLSSVIINTLKETTVKLNTSDRFYYAFQILTARKFSDGFSLQLVPTLVHYNLADSSMSNNLYSIGAGARFKLTKRSSLNMEYYYQMPSHKLPGTYNSFAIGYEIETAGHVFQLQLTNSYGMTERTFINETRSKWSNGGIHFGFNISRVFVVKKPKTYNN